MRIFLSYASEDRDLAEQVTLALIAERHDVFFDKNSLPPAGDFRSSIREAVANSHCMVFLVTTHSVARGSFALTELEHAKRKWAHPRDHVLPVRIGSVPWESIPQYLKAVNVLEPVGDVAEAIVAAVANLAANTDKPTEPEGVPRKRWWPKVTFAVSFTIGLAFISVMVSPRRPGPPQPEPSVTEPAIIQASPPEVSTTSEASVLCRDPIDKRPTAPAGFDFGYRDSCRAYVYINDDDICDYCRTVGDRNLLRCVLGTATGLNGVESDPFTLEGGAPYPDTCVWTPHQGTKTPALRGEIGDNHEYISITPVTMSQDGKQIVIGPTRRLPNMK